MLQSSMLASQYPTHPWQVTNPPSGCVLRSPGVAAQAFSRPCGVANIISTSSIFGVTTDNRIISGPQHAPNSVIWRHATSSPWDILAARNCQPVPDRIRCCSDEPKEIDSKHFKPHWLSSFLAPRWWCDRRAAAPSSPKFASWRCLLPPKC